MRSISVIALCIIMATGLFGQRFGAAISVGMNASQIAGDQLAGFDKIGLLAGLRGIAHVNDKLDLNLDFLYSVRGSRPDIFNASVDPDIDVTLQYLDLPVYATYSDWYDQENDIYKVFALGGFSYGRLLDASTFDTFNDGEENLDTLVEYFNNNDVSWLLGLGFRAGRHITFSMRYTRSITLLLNAEKNKLNTNSLRPFFISFRVDYVL